MSSSNIDFSCSFSTSSSSSSLASFFLSTLTFSFFAFLFLLSTLFVCLCPETLQLYLLFRDSCQPYSFRFPMFVPQHLQYSLYPDCCPRAHFVETPPLMVIEDLAIRRGSWRESNEKRTSAKLSTKMIQWVMTIALRIIFFESSLCPGVGKLSLENNQDAHSSRRLMCCTRRG